MNGLSLQVIFIIVLHMLGLLKGTGISILTNEIMISTSANNSNHYLYAWIDPRKIGNFHYQNLNYGFEKEPFYIGQTVDIRDRKRCHLKDSYSNRDSNILKSRKFNKIKRETNSDPEFVIIKSGLTQEEVDKLEIEFIEKIGTINLKTGPLTNLARGGLEGTRGLKWSEESRNKRKGSGNPMFGKTGNLHPQFGTKASVETRKKQSIKKLKHEYHIFDPIGKEFITNNLRNWEKENNFPPGSIRKVVDGSVSSYKGWTAYIEGQENKLKKLKILQIEYVLFDRFGNVYQTKNIFDFFRKMNIATPTTLTRKINSNKWSIDGFKIFTKEKSHMFVNDYYKYKITNTDNNKQYLVDDYREFFSLYLQVYLDERKGYLTGTLYKNIWKIEKLNEPSI